MTKKTQEAMTGIAVWYCAWLQQEHGEALFPSEELKKRQERHLYEAAKKFVANFEKYDLND